VVDELEVLLPVDFGDEREIVEAVVPELSGGIEESFAGDLQLGIAVAPLEGGAVDGGEDVLDEGRLRGLFGLLGGSRGWRRRG
jgi:hypothetical protein